MWHASRTLVAVVVLLLLARGADALENGLARTPPMGWMSWTKFYCELDCARHPFSCISEDLYKSMARRMAEDGFRDAGYEYVHIDDCWMESRRDDRGRLVPNGTRFPGGMNALADYIHDLGLKFATYEDYGNHTCMGYPGSYGHLNTDAQTFADWTVDYLKLDGCDIDIAKMPFGNVATDDVCRYPAMEKSLNRTGRPIVYSCSWPAYMIDHPKLVDYKKIAESCNLWRNYADIARSWASIVDIVHYYVRNQDKLIAAHGPGHWNDPDMIIAGNTEITLDQARAQLSVWAVWSAPLIMSNDLRTIDADLRDALLNSRMIAIDQDPLGKMGEMVHNTSDAYVFVKRMTPYDTAKTRYSYAIAIVNYADHPIHFETDLASLGLNYADGYRLYDVWADQAMGLYQPADVYSTRMPPTSSVLLTATLPYLVREGENSAVPPRSTRKFGKPRRFSAADDD